MNVIELRSKKDSLVKELESIVNGEGFTKEAFESKESEIRGLADQIKSFEKVEEMRAAMAQVPAPVVTKVEERKMENTELGIYKALVQEKRAINLTLANGEKSYSKYVFGDHEDKTDLLDLVTVEYDATPNTLYPLFSPSMITFNATDEAGTGSAVSLTAFAPKNVLTVPYVGYVPVQDSYMRFGPVNFEQKLQSAFAISAKAKLCSLIVTKLFTDDTTTLDTTCAIAGAPTLADLNKLISQVSGIISRKDLSLLIHPQFWASVLSAGLTNSQVVFSDGYYYLNGVRIVENKNCPTTITAASIVAVAGQFSDYGVAIASDVDYRILPRAAGTLADNVQSTFYAGHDVIVASSFAQLKTI